MTNFIKAVALVVIAGIIMLTGAYAITEHTKSSDPTIIYPYHAGVAEREIIAEGIKNFMPDFDPIAISAEIDHNGLAPYVCGYAGAAKYVYGFFVPDEDGNYVFEPIFVGNDEMDKAFMRSFCGNEWIYD